MARLTFCLLLLLSFSAKSQEKGSLYVFDADWKPTEIKKAYFLLHIYQENDTCWQWDYYHFTGPLVKTEQYRDKEGTILNGVCHYYDETGHIDSLATYRVGKKNGDSWRQSGDSSKYRLKYVYLDNSLISFTDPSKQEEESSVSYKDEKESEYPGGFPAWQRYLSKHLDYPERAMNGNIMGSVWVGFIVDKEGHLISPYIDRSVEYSLDQEAMKIIQESGKWQPAFQNGQTVKSYKLQPINFRLE